MAYEKINYNPGDVLTANQMNKIQDEIIRNNGNIEGHIESTDNPHKVTAAQVGAAPAASVAYIDKNDNETVIITPSSGDGGDSSPGSGGLTAEEVQAMIDAALGGIENGTY